MGRDELHEIIGSLYRYWIIDTELEQLRNIIQSYLFDWQHADDSKHGYFWRTSEILAAVYLAMLIAERTKSAWVSVRETSEWKQIYLSFWENEIKAHEPEREKYFSEFTKVIHQVFDELVAVIDKRESNPRSDSLRKAIFENDAAEDVVWDCLKRLMKVVQNGLYVLQVYPSEYNYEREDAVYHVIEAVYLINLIAQGTHTFPIEVDIVKQWKDDYLAHLDTARDMVSQKLIAKREPIEKMFDNLIQYVDNYEISYSDNDE